MSQTAYSIIDADGHVTESLEQVSKYLDAPYNRRPHTFPFDPWDGWDRRMLGTLGDNAGTAEQWLRALDLGGMEQAVLYPTLGLFLSFLKDREWAVALCRAYNTFLHEEFVKQTPRLHAVALLPVQDPDVFAVHRDRDLPELAIPLRVGRRVAEQVLEPRRGVDPGERFLRRRVDGRHAAGQVREVARGLARIELP